jgi:hypothetical protein
MTGTGADGGNYRAQQKGCVEREVKIDIWTLQTTVKRMRKNMLCEPLSWAGDTRKWYRFGILKCSQI